MLKWCFTVASALLLAAWIFSAWRQVFYTGPYWAVRLQAGRIEVEHLSDPQGPRGPVRLPRYVKRGVFSAPYSKISISTRFGFRWPQCFRRTEMAVLPPSVGRSSDEAQRFNANLPTGPAYRTYVAIPLWLLMLIAAPLTIALWRLDSHFPPNHCQRCGYNLTGNVTGRCPECGSEVAQSP